MYTNYNSSHFDAGSFIIWITLDDCVRHMFWDHSTFTSNRGGTVAKGGGRDTFWRKGGGRFAIRIREAGGILQRPHKGGVFPINKKYERTHFHCSLSLTPPPSHTHTHTQVMSTRSNILIICTSLPFFSNNTGCKWGLYKMSYTKGQYTQKKSDDILCN